MVVLQGQAAVVEVLFHSMMFSIIIPTLNEEHALFKNSFFFKKLNKSLMLRLF